MELLEIGRIVRLHGLAGHVKVLSYLESPAALNDLSGVFVGRNIQGAVAFAPEVVQHRKDFFILKLKGIGDRDAAAKLVGASVWISTRGRRKLPEGEYYWKEIIGLQVVTEDDQVLGRIEAVFPTGSNDVYVCRGGEREILLPAIVDVVRKIDTDRGVVVVRLMKGL